MPAGAQANASDPFTTLQAFLSAVKTAPLFSRCGGPYPDDQRLRPISWEEAGPMLDSYALDVSPHLELDKLMTTVCREVYHKLAGEKEMGCLLSLWSCLTTCPYERNEGTRSLKAFRDTVDDELRDFIRKRAGLMVENAKKKTSPVEENDWLTVAPVAAGDALCELLMTVAELIRFSDVAQYPLLKCAAQIALDGYLPLDVEHTERGDVLLVY